MDVSTGSRFYNCRFEGNKSQTSLGYGNATGAIGLDGDLSNSFFQDKYLIIDGCSLLGMKEEQKLALSMRDIILKYTIPFL